MTKLLLLFLFIISCSVKQDSPEFILKSFIDKRFAKKLSKVDALDLTTGSFFEKLKQMDDTQWLNYKNIANLKKRKFKLLVKRCQDHTCYLTYTLSYRHFNNDNKETAIVDVKKIAELERIENNWKISNISNVKSYIDSKQEIIIK